MDARTPLPEETASEAAAAGVGEKLNAYGLARRRRERRRRMIRGAVGILALLAIWQAMSVAYDLQLILPPPLAVGRTIVETLTPRPFSFWRSAASPRVSRVSTVRSGQLSSWEISA